MKLVGNRTSSEFGGTSGGGKLRVLEPQERQTGVNSTRGHWGSFISSCFFRFESQILPELTQIPDPRFYILTHWGTYDTSDAASRTEGSEAVFQYSQCTRCIGCVLLLLLSVHLLTSWLHVLSTLWINIIMSQVSAEMTSKKRLDLHALWQTGSFCHGCTCWTLLQQQSVYQVF